MKKLAALAGALLIAVPAFGQPAAGDQDKPQTAPSAAADNQQDSAAKPDDAGQPTGGGSESAAPKPDEAPGGQPESAPATPKPTA